MKRQQIQQQKQVSAYEKKVTHDLFLMSLEWLEKYIEVVYENEFPDWQNRKQIHDDNIKRTDIDNNPTMAEDTLSTQLLLLETNLKRRPEFVREEIKEEFYKWINAVRIDKNNCPERLKHFLFGIHEILEGRGEKIRKDVENEKPTVDSNSSEYMEQMRNLFAYTHVASQKEEKVEKSLEGQTYKDIEIKSKFGSGDTKSGEQAFQRIAGTVSSSHEASFHFFPQQGQQSNSPQQLTNSEIIQDVIRNKNQVWRIDDVIIYQDGVKYITKALIKKSVQLEYDETGYPLFNSENMYQESRFNEEEKMVINQVLGISSLASTNYYQKDESTSTTPNSNNSSLGTISLIVGVLAISSLGIYGVVKKSKKVKNSR